jgi:hypothetical protein
MKIRVIEAQIIARPSGKASSVSRLKESPDSQTQLEEVVFRANGTRCPIRMPGLWRYCCENELVELAQVRLVRCDRVEVLV